MFEGVLTGAEGNGISLDKHRRRARLGARLMFETGDTQKVERALLVRIYQKEEETAEQAQLMLDELGQLVETLGIPVIDQMLVRVSKLQARYLMGTGKADEVNQRVIDQDLDCVVFDNALAPAQQRNWEALTKQCVIDREEVILDIFAEHARTKEARLQVELAQMNYSLPRLKRAWTHLSRQGGGGGSGSGGAARGEGEQQIEVDRRIVRKRIDRIKAELEEVQKQRATQRKDRSRLPVPTAAIVGYTNAGKSSLLNCLTGADALVENKLFATLDTTTRRIELDNGQTLLLTDTVGFVRNLPHHLVESFKATLEETLVSDYLIHLLDGSQPEVYEFHRTTIDVLQELGADTSQMLTVFNKIDLIEDPAVMHGLRRRFPDALFISVHTGEGIEELKTHLAAMLADRTARVELRLPQSEGQLLALIYKEGQVLDTKYDGNDILLTAVIPTRLRNRYADYEMPKEPAKKRAVSSKTASARKAKPAAAAGAAS